MKPLEPLKGIDEPPLMKASMEAERGGAESGDEMEKNGGDVDGKYTNLQPSAVSSRLIIKLIFSLFR